jgi:prophage regulatory protein
MSATIYDLKGLRILTKKQVCALVPYTPQHIHRLEKAGRFPRRLQLGPNRVGWRLVDIERWVNERAAVAGASPAASPPDDDEIAF